MARLLATARTSVAVRQTAEVVALKIRSLVRQLTMLDQEIADLDHAIAEPFGQLGYRPADFPAGGVVAGGVDQVGAVLLSQPGGEATEVAKVEPGRPGGDLLLGQEGQERRDHIIGGTQEGL